MTMFILIYLLTAAMIASVLLMTTSEGFNAMERKKAVSSIVLIVLLAVIWFPVLIYITIWTAARKIKQKNFKN